MESPDTNKVTQDEIEALLYISDHFGISFNFAFRYLSPTLCKVYKVVGVSGNFGIKLYPAIYSGTELLSEIDMVRKLRESGCPVAEYKLTIEEKKYLVLPNQLKVTVYRWIEGDQMNISEGRLKKLISVVDRMIPVTSAASEFRSSDWLWDESKKYYASIDIPSILRRWVKNHLPLKCPWDKLTSGLCHNDISSKNVIWQSRSTPYLIDFTNSITAPVEWEFATMSANIALDNINDLNLSSLKLAIAGSQTAKKRRMDINLFHEYLPMAIAQRLVFKAAGNREDRFGRIWQIAQHVIEQL